VWPSASAQYPDRWVVRTHNYHGSFPERPAKKATNKSHACKTTGDDIHHQSSGKAFLDDGLIDGHTKERCIDGVQATGAGADGGELGLPRRAEMGLRVSQSIDLQSR
jgi:hypothetical protein